MKGKSGNLLGKLLLIAIVFGFFVPVAAHAEQDSDARIEKLEAAVEALQAELAALKAERARAPVSAGAAVDQKRLEELVNKTFEEKKSEYAAPSWVQGFKPFGDFRYRHESIDDTDAGKDKRNRNRIRARLGVKVKVNEDWDAIFRVATGSSDTPTSTNQTLGDSDSDSFSSKEIWLDWAYADWHPASRPGLNIYAGKMKQPFYRVGKNQLVWDGDVSPEGIAASYKWALNDSTTAYINGGGFWLAERSGDADSSLWGAQGYVKHEFQDKTYLLGGVTYYDLGNIDGVNDISGVGLNGNTNNGADGYKYDFDLIEGFAEYGFKCMEMPVAVFGNYINNTAAPGGRNTAYSLGCTINKAKKPGSWQFGYMYADVQSDAVFAGLTDSDFLLGGTGGKGHKFGFKYQLFKNIQAGLTYFITQRNARGASGEQDIDLLQADLILKF
jgi:hypothetical protein